jgi:hypothetical protein
MHLGERIGTTNRLTLSMSRARRLAQRRGLAQMPARIHAFAQDPHNLDQVRMDRPVVDDMYWSPDAVRAAYVPDVETADAG